MNTLLKSMLIATTPALLASIALAADTPATQPQPATQPTIQPLAQSSNPIVVPDGTSPQNPGPTANPTWQGQTITVSGLRQ